MKLTKSMLIEMVKQELKEFSGTAQVRGAKPQGYKSAERTTKKGTYNTAKTTKATKKAAKTTKQTAYDSAQSDYETKLATYNTRATGEPDKFQWTVGRRIVTGATAPRGASNLQTRSAWTTWNNRKTTAASERDTALSTRNKKLAAKNTADSEYDTAVSDEESSYNAWRDQIQADWEATQGEAPPVGGYYGGGDTGGKKGGGKKGGGK